MSKTVNTCASAHAHTEVYNLSETALREDGIAELERRIEQLRSKLRLAVVFAATSRPQEALSTSPTTRAHGRAMRQLRIILPILYVKSAFATFR